MKLQNITGLGMLMSAAIGMFGVSSAQAQVFQATGSAGGNPVDATASFTLGNGTLTLVIVNMESAAGFISSGQAISGISFSGLTGTTTMTSGTGDLIDINPDGSITQVANSANDLQSSAYGDGVHWHVSGTDSMTSLGGGQPEMMIYGAPNGSGDYPNINGGVGNFNPYVEETATFVLSNQNIGLQTIISGVSFTFGTPDGTLPGTPVPPSVPEASTVFAGALMLLPLGVGTIRALRKEKALAPAKIS